MRSGVRKIIDSLPDDNVPDRLLIPRAVEGIELIPARMKGPGYLHLMLQDQKKLPVLAATALMPDSIVRLWMQTVSGLFLTTARLHKMFPQQFE